MAIEHDLAAYLTAQATVTALVGTRIYDDHIPQNTPRPAIVYRVIGGNRYYHTTGPSGLARTDVQLVFHGEDDGSPLLPRQIYDAVRLKVDGESGTWGSSTVKSAFLSLPQNASGLPHLGTENGYPALSAVLEITHTESVPA